MHAQADAVALERSGDQTRGSTYDQPAAWAGRDSLNNVEQQHLSVPCAGPAATTAKRGIHSSDADSWHTRPDPRRRPGARCSPNQRITEPFNPGARGGLGGKTRHPWIQAGAHHPISRSSEKYAAVHRPPGCSPST